MTFLLQLIRCHPSYQCVASHLFSEATYSFRSAFYIRYTPQNMHYYVSQIQEEEKSHGRYVLKNMKHMRFEKNNLYLHLSKQSII